MKNYLFAIALLFTTASLTQAQDKKPPMSPRLTVESPDKNIKIMYGQP